MFSSLKVLILLCVVTGCSSLVKRHVSSRTDAMEEELAEKCFLKNGKIKKVCSNIKYKNTCENTDRVRCVKTFDEKMIPVSIVTSSEVALIKAQVSHFRAEFYNDIESGGHPRAFYIAGVLLKLKAPIYVGQVRITGEFQFKDEDWVSHIAPFVYVKNGNRLQKLVIDPAILPGKVEPLNKWLSVIKSDSSKLITRLFGPYLIFNYTIDASNSIEEVELEKDKRHVISHSFDEFKPKYRDGLISLLYLAASTIREE